jgi:hypothetical protein
MKNGLPINSVVVKKSNEPAGGKPTGIGLRSLEKEGHMGNPR